MKDEAEGGMIMTEEMMTIMEAVEETTGKLC